jgi:hypothetical protein
VGAAKRCFIDGSKVMPPDKTLAASSALKAAWAAPTDAARWYLNAYTGKSFCSPGFRRSLQSTSNAGWRANLGDAAAQLFWPCLKKMQPGLDLYKIGPRRFTALRLRLFQPTQPFAPPPHSQRGPHQMLYPQTFDVIVVGGGHAGTEAALAAARMGCKTLLLSHNIETLGQMSCNPSIGGIGKGHLVKEIDAMGGAMALATDEAGIQFRILNRSKGPAVRATRAQADRILYKAAIRKRLENQPNLWLFQQAVDDLMVEGDRVVGAVTQVGIRFRSRTVVLTAGTFLDGKIHVGMNNHAGGRAGDPPAVSLSARLAVQHI